MELDRLLLDYKLVQNGQTQNELNLPQILVFYQHQYASLLPDIRHGILLNGCVAQFVALPSVNEDCCTTNAKESLLSLRESTADLAFALCETNLADGIMVVADSTSLLVGVSLTAIRKNLPLVVLPIVNISQNPHPLLLKAQIESTKMSRYAFEQQFSLSHNHIDDYMSLVMFFIGSGLCLADVLEANKTELCRKSGQLIAKRTTSLSYPKKDLTLSSFTNGLKLHLSVRGTISSLVHIFALSYQNSINIDYDFVVKLSQDTPQYTLNLSQGIGGILKHLITNKIIFAKQASEYFCQFSQMQGDLPPNSTTQKQLNTVKGNLCHNALSCFSEQTKPFKGQVFCFESESLARTAIFLGNVLSNSVIVIFGQSANDNGMPPLDIESALIAMELQNVLIITDGRLIEFGCHPFICLMEKTELMDAIKPQDIIEFDPKKQKLNLVLPSKEISNRIKKIVKPAFKSSLILSFASKCNKPSQGCTTKN